MSGNPNFRFVEETGSTNADLAAQIRGEAPTKEGDWLVAHRQTAGRGRQGREWFDGAGNFMGSTVVKIGTDDPPPATLSFITALAVHDAVTEWIGSLGEVSVKWPNDVLLDGGKVSGILLELVGQHVVIGVGVNIAKAPSLVDRETSAIGDYAENCLPKDFLESLAGQITRLLPLWRSQPLSWFLSEFQRHSIHQQGSPMTVHDTDGSSISGSYMGLEETDGALRLRLADGSERVIRAGDIS